MIAAVRAIHAVIPAAGRGTRLLPLTRALPKELLPLGRRPVLDHVVAELGDAGITHAVLVTARGKTALVDHLDGHEARVRIAAVRQPEPRGLGDAVRCAEGLTGDGPFVVALGDALVDPPALRDLLAAAGEPDVDGAILVERVPRDRLDRYGIVGVDDAGIVTRLVEKPVPADAPSDLAIAARYVLPHAIFGALAATAPGADGEVQLTDAIAGLVAAGARLRAVTIPPGGRRLDVGSPAGYVGAFAALALDDPELGPVLREAVAAHRGGRSPGP
jgi:UTP--glucose-1-phosphate uridylyltransferase